MFEIEDNKTIDQLPCSLAEWVQWLQACCHVPLMGIWGFVENGKIKKYMVATNGVMPPVSWGITIMYQNFYRDHEIGFECLEALERWAHECGAVKIIIQSKFPHIMEDFGFEKETSCIMELDLSKKTIAQVKKDFNSSRISRYGNNENN